MRNNCTKPFALGALLIFAAVAAAGGIAGSAELSPFQEILEGERFVSLSLL